MDNRFYFGFNTSEERKKRRKAELYSMSEQVSPFFWDEAPQHGLEMREGQQDMSFEIVDALINDQHFAIEAGVGIGKSVNGGFGMVLDGSERVDTILRMSMPWDTMVGVARRSWARNDNAVTTAMEYNRLYAGQDHITLPYAAPEDDDIIAAVLHGAR